MPTLKNQLVLCKEDYNLLLSFMRTTGSQSAYDRQNTENLQAELEKAMLVNKAEFPRDVVRINSIVKVKAEGNDQVMELRLVTPDQANIKERKISVMAPVGTALLGFRQGEKVDWQVPAGRKTFTILEVIN